MCAFIHIQCAYTQKEIIQEKKHVKDFNEGGGGGCYHLDYFRRMVLFPHQSLLFPYHWCGNTQTSVKFHINFCYFRTNGAEITRIGVEIYLEYKIPI
jgi:hypothetical protein